ncbi:MAG: S1/P1 nuclease [Balneolaceae bacterium]|nr:S1/P1 nuclease [Balneolaceae bacterium]
MRYLFLVLALVLFTTHSTGEWGKNGHRAVGDIASAYLTDEAKEHVKRILEGESMAIASTWMDEIKSDPAYDHTHDWHWVTIPDGMTYDETEKNPNGDLINTIRTVIKELKSGSLNKEEETENLKMLIHLIGDIHQPLHVGTGEDRGGNDVDVRWFWSNSNLHRVWDSGMIDESQLSYTELAESVNHPTEEEIKEWQNSDVLDWARESMELRDEVYDLPSTNDINYEYMYHKYPIIEKRLLQAGVRLAGVLNEIYG